MIITFCGHSTYMEKQGDRKTLLFLLENIIQGNDVIFYLGGYGHFDNFALSVVTEYKKTHARAKAVFVTPYMGEEYLETKYDSRLYDEVLYPPLETVPLKFAISKRNEWMAKEAEYVIAGVRHRYGGAYAMMLCAKRKKKQIINLFEE